MVEFHDSGKCGRGLWRGVVREGYLQVEKLLTAKVAKKGR